MSGKSRLAMGGEGESFEMASDPFLVDEMPSEAAGFLDSPSSSLATPPSRKGWRLRFPVILWTVTGVVLFVAVLGLGLALRSHRTEADQLRGSGVEDWRLDTNQYVLDMKWDLNAPPTTRHFDFVITKGKGWPDGKFWSPGPAQKNP